MTQEPIQNLIGDRLETTPFDAQKTAELDVQFAIDPSYGLSRERYGWYSNDVLFDDTHFTTNGSIQIETSATAGDTARLRSAYPGRYVAHTLAEPGIGYHIPSQHVEYVERNGGEYAQLTHGEISVELVEWDEVNDTGITAHGLSFEPDGTYVQIRDQNQDIEFVHQEDWNMDPMDGTGPSGEVLRPEEGQIANFPFTWYGHGAMIVAIQDVRNGKLVPVHRADFSGDVSISNPNLPLQVTVENKDTADPLGCNVGGMQFATHGSTGFTNEEAGRETQVSRHTGSSYIDRNVTLTNNEIDPFAQPGRPIVSVRRDLSELDSRVSLGVEVTDLFANVGGDVYVFIFDEFDATNALTGQNFRTSSIQQNTEESRLQVDTEATDYTPGANSVLRSMLYISGDKNTADVITGDSNSRLPIDATIVMTAALPPGSNSTYAQPGMLTLREGF